MVGCGLGLQITAVRPRGAVSLVMKALDNRMEKLYCTTKPDIALRSKRNSAADRTGPKS